MPHFIFERPGANDQQVNQREWFASASSCATDGISVHGCAPSLYVNDTHNNNSKTPREQFCPVRNKPAKYTGILEIYYSKDHHIEALALRVLPPTTWKLPLQKHSLVTGSTERKWPHLIARRPSLLGRHYEDPQPRFTGMQIKNTVGNSIRISSCQSGVLSQFGYSLRSSECICFWGGKLIHSLFKGRLVKT